MTNETEKIRIPKENEIEESSFSDNGALGTANFLKFLGIFLGALCIAAAVIYQENTSVIILSIIAGIIGGGVLFGFGKLIEIVSDIRIELYEQGEKNK